MDFTINTPSRADYTPITIGKLDPIFQVYPSWPAFFFLPPTFRFLPIIIVIGTVSATIALCRLVLKRMSCYRICPHTNRVIPGSSVSGAFRLQHLAQSCRSRQLVLLHAPTIISREVTQRSKKRFMPHSLRNDAQGNSLPLGISRTSPPGRV